MYAIINKKNKKYLYGTDYSCCPFRQRLSYDNAKLFEFEDEAIIEFKKRRCNCKTYKVVEVELKIKEVNNGQQN